MTWGDSPVTPLAQPTQGCASYVKRGSVVGMSTKPSTPTTRAPGKRLTREMIDTILAGDPVLREDVERRLASQITQPSGETAAAMTHSLATLQEMADGIAAKQDAVDKARIAMIHMSEGTLKPITYANADDGATVHPASPEEFDLHLKVVAALAKTLRPEHKAVTEQFDLKLLPLAVRSAKSCLKQTAMREMSEAYGVGRQQMYKLAAKDPEGRGKRPKVSGTTADLPEVALTREQMQDTLDTIDDLHEDIARLLFGRTSSTSYVPDVHDVLGTAVEKLQQMGEHILNAQGAVHASRTTLLELAVTVLAPITYDDPQDGEDAEGNPRATTADEYAVHLKVVAILAGVLRSEHERITYQLEKDLQAFAVRAVVSANRNSAVARVAEAYGVARQNVERLVRAAHPGFLGGLRFKHTA